MNGGRGKQPKAPVRMDDFIVSDASDLNDEEMVGSGEDEQESLERQALKHVKAHRRNRNKALAGGKKGSLAEDFIVESEEEELEDSENEKGGK